MSRSTAPEPASKRWFLLALLTAGLFFCYAQRNALSVAAPFMMKDLGLNPAAMGVLLSSFFWSYSVAHLPAGWMIDRYGVGRVYAAGYVVWTAGVMLSGVVGTLGMLIVARIVTGVGQAVAFPGSARVAANWFPAGERGGVTGLYLTGNRLGQAAISAAGPPIVAVYGWRMLFLIVGIAGLSWLIARLFSGTWERRGGAGSAAHAPVSFRDTLVALRDRRIAGVALGFFAYDYVWFLFLAWMPGYLMLERKFTAREMAIYGSIPFLAVSFVTVFAGVLGDWLVRRGWNEITVRKAIITAGLGIACLIVPAAYVENNALSAWLLAASICGLGMAAPNCWALTQAVCPKPLVATASGIQNFGGNIGGVIAPALSGFIAHWTGSFGLAFVVAALILAGGIASYWLLIPRFRA